MFCTVVGEFYESLYTRTPSVFGCIFYIKNDSSLNSYHLSCILHLFGTTTAYLLLFKISLPPRFYNFLKFPSSFMKNGSKNRSEVTPPSKIDSGFDTLFRPVNLPLPRKVVPFTSSVYYPFLRPSSQDTDHRDQTVLAVHPSSSPVHLRSDMTRSVPYRYDGVARPVTVVRTTWPSCDVARKITPDTMFRCIVLMYKIGWER